MRILYTIRIGHSLFVVLFWVKCHFVTLRVSENKLNLSLKFEKNCNLPVVTLVTLVCSIPVPMNTCRIRTVRILYNLIIIFLIKISVISVIISEIRIEQIVIFGNLRVTLNFN